MGFRMTAIATGAGKETGKLSDWRHVWHADASGLDPRGWTHADSVSRTIMAGRRNTEKGSFITEYGAPPLPLGPLGLVRLLNLLRLRSYASWASC
eukprot:1745521-Prorocentrum_lima.AAC.1